MKIQKRLLLTLVLLLTVSLPSFSKELQGEKLPIVVEAQKLSYDDNKKVAVYIGNVIAQRGSTLMKGDKLTIYFDKTGKFIEKIEVVGNVQIEDPRGRGRCDRLIYYPAQEKVVLIGNAELRQDKNVIIGDRIVAYKEGRISVEGVKQRVKTVIYPEGKVGKGFRP